MARKKVQPFESVAAMKAAFVTCGLKLTHWATIGRGPTPDGFSAHDLKFEGPGTVSDVLFFKKKLKALGIQDVDVDFSPDIDGKDGSDMVFGQGYAYVKYVKRATSRGTAAKD